MKQELHKNLEEVEGYIEKNGLPQIDYGIYNDKSIYNLEILKVQKRSKIEVLNQFKKAIKRI